MSRKKIYVIGGGTVSHIRNHLALCAPAYGQTARTIADILNKKNVDMDVELHLTKMAGGDSLETNVDVQKLIDEIKLNTAAKIIFFNPALVDFKPNHMTVFHDGEGKEVYGETRHGLNYFDKYGRRLETRNTIWASINISPANKLISKIRDGRKDIFLVGFKTTCGATKQEMFEKGLRLCKEGSVNLVLVNDTKTRWNMIVTPEEAAYHETSDRMEVLNNLVDMALLRSNLTFTQSTVVDGQLVPWNSALVPDSLRKVVDFCVNGNAYKPFNGSTVGHFATKLSDTEFLTSVRRSNFNDLDKVGLVKIVTSGPDTVLAYGAKPSVGGQSQRIVFKDHEGFDCIVHFHSPLKANPRDTIPIRSQREYECGSHGCGQNTSDGLKQFGNLKAVYLDQHGPNIIFNKNIDPKEVIDFISANFDLDKKTGGYNLTNSKN